MTPYECICRCISRVKINHSSGLKTKEEKRSYRTAFDHFWPKENRERILVVKKNIKIVIPAPLICDIVHYKSKEDYCASMGGIYRFFFFGPFCNQEKIKIRHKDDHIQTSKHAPRTSYPKTSSTAPGQKSRKFQKKIIHPQRKKGAKSTPKWCLANLIFETG